MARLDDAQLWERYRAVLLALDGTRVTEALSCLMVALIHVSRATNTSLLSCVRALVELWDDDGDSLIITEEELPASGPITEREPGPLN